MKTTETNGNHDLVDNGSKSSTNIPQAAFVAIYGYKRQVVRFEMNRWFWRNSCGYEGTSIRDWEYSTIGLQHNELFAQEDKILKVIYHIPYSPPISRWKAYTPKKEHTGETTCHPWSPPSSTHQMVFQRQDCPFLTASRVESVFNHRGTSDNLFQRAI